MVEDMPGATLVTNYRERTWVMLRKEQFTSLLGWYYCAAKYQMPIMCFIYIDNPSSMTSDVDRRSCKDHFNEFIEELKKENSSNYQL